METGNNNENRVHDKMTSRSTQVVVQHNEKGQQICSARSKQRPGDYCRSTAIFSNGRCKNHGGPSLSGAAHPRFRTGARSRYLPTRLLGKFQESLADPELLNLTYDAALVNARIDELLETLDQGGTGKIFVEIADAVQAFEYANQDGDRKAMREAWRRLEDAVTRGKNEASRWSEIDGAIERKRKLAISQARREKDLALFVPIAEANNLVAALIGSIREHVRDANILNLIIEDFKRRTSRDE